MIVLINDFLDNVLSMSLGISVFYGTVLQNHQQVLE
jgi:hypothetical protein